MPPRGVKPHKDKDKAAEYVQARLNEFGPELKKRILTAVRHASRGDQKVFRELMGFRFVSSRGPFAGFNPKDCLGGMNANPIYCRGKRMEALLLALKDEAGVAGVKLSKVERKAVLDQALERAVELARDRAKRECSIPAPYHDDDDDDDVDERKPHAGRAARSTTAKHAKKTELPRAETRSLSAPSAKCWRGSSLEGELRSFKKEILLDVNEVAARSVNAKFADLEAKFADLEAKYADLEAKHADLEAENAKLRGDVETLVESKDKETPHASESDEESYNT